MDSQTVFAALRDALAELYSGEQDSHVVVADAGLDASQITFSNRAQTNWHNILAEALRQNRLDALLQVVLASSYSNNPTLQAAYGHYRHLIDQGDHIEPPTALAADSDPTPTIAIGSTYIAGNVTTDEGDVIGRDQQIDGDKVGRDQIEGDQIDASSSKGFINRPTAPVTQHFGTTVNLGPSKISKPIVGILFAGFVVIVMLIGAIAFYTRGTFQAATAPIPTLTPTIPTVTPTKTPLPTTTPLPTATPLAFATGAPEETLIVIAQFYVPTGNSDHLLKSE